MRANNFDGAFIARRNAGMRSDFNRLRKAHQMRRLNRQRDADPRYRARWVAALRKGLKGAARCEKLRQHMLALQRYWAEQKDDPAVIRLKSNRGRRAAASRRGLAIPAEIMPLYETLRRKVGMREAVRILGDELARVGS
jgi:hypothetical protein